MNNLVEHYENELKKTEKAIEELWEVGKISAAKNNRKREIELILDGLTAREQINKLNDTITALKRRLKSEGINIDEEVSDL